LDMITHTDRVAVIVVNFNGGTMLLRCLATLRAQSLRPSRVIIVDNASSDGSIDAAEQSFPDFEFVRMDRNIGFAAANNHAAHLANDCQWLALLNPDAYAAPNWLENTMAATHQNPTFSVFGARLLRSDDPSRLDGIGDTYHACGLAWREGHGQMASTGSNETNEVFSACAAAAVYRREDFMSVGGFDDDYLCYFEDVDLGFRLRLFGHRCLLVPDAVVYHVGAAATGGQNSDFAVYHGHRNLVWTYVKNMPGAIFWPLLPLHIGLNLITIAWFVLRGQGAVILRAKRDALRGIPRMWRKRCEIRKHRVVSGGEIWKALDKRFFIFAPHVRKIIS
jgi:GT2 family glycosyltransferase